MQILDGRLVSQATKDDLKIKVAQLKAEGKKTKLKLKYYLFINLFVNDILYSAKYDSL